MLGEDMTLARVIDIAFDYRGNVTVVKADETETVGYISNRNHSVPEPFLQMFDEKGDGPFKLLYSEVRNIRFTGRDTAAGKSWEAWVKRREREKARDRAEATRSKPALAGQSPKQ